MFRTWWLYYVAASGRLIINMWLRFRLTFHKVRPAQYKRVAVHFITLERRKVTNKLNKLIWRRFLTIGRSRETGAEVTQRMGEVAEGVILLDGWGALLEGFSRADTDDGLRPPIGAVKTLTSGHHTIEARLWAKVPHSTVWLPAFDFWSPTAGGCHIYCSTFQIWRSDSGFYIFCQLLVTCVTDLSFFLLFASSQLATLMSTDFKIYKWHQNYSGNWLTISLLVPTVRIYFFPYGPRICYFEIPTSWAVWKQSQIYRVKVISVQTFNARIPEYWYPSAARWKNRRQSWQIATFIQWAQNIARL